MPGTDALSGIRGTGPRSGPFFTVKQPVKFATKTQAVDRDKENDGILGIVFLVTGALVVGC